MNLSTSELNALHNTKFYAVKASATKKIDALLAEVRDSLKGEIKKNNISFPKEVDSKNGKIFRGENYLGLPYLVLDYPKHFSKESVFSFRTMFWWGNFFSFTLHLQGKALKMHRSALLSQMSSLKKKNTYICVNNNPWQYHYGKDNYILTDKLSDAELKKLIREKEFIKLSRKTTLKDHKKLKPFCLESFRLFLGFAFAHQV